MIIDWPNLPAMRPESVEWSPPVFPELVSTSPFNQSTQAQVMGAPYYVVKISIGSRRRTEVPAFEALIAQFARTSDRIRLWDWRWEAARGLATGAPLVNGGGQTGSAIATDGWTASTAGLLLPGDYVGLSGQLRRVVQQVDSNGAGQAVLNLDAPVRTSPADNAAVVLARPTSLFICTTDKRSRGFVQEGARHRGPTLEFMEVFA
jgi:hypothetical protein